MHELNEVFSQRFTTRDAARAFCGTDYARRLALAHPNTTPDLAGLREELSLLDAWRTNRVVPSDGEDRRLLVLSIVGEPHPTRVRKIWRLLESYGAVTVHDIPTDRFAEFLIKLEAAL